MDPVLGASSYSWSLPSGGGFSFLGGTPSTNAAIIRTGSTDGTYQIICTPQGCGAAGSRYLTVIIDSGGIIQLRAAYPNPTNDLFIVKLKETESSEVAEISLTNKFLEKVYTLKTPEKEISISTQNLPDGTYYLNILLGKELTQKQVLVKH